MAQEVLGKSGIGRHDVDGIAFAQSGMERFL
jgi:hypothetical protein